MAAQNPKPHTLEEVFNDFKGRRTGLLKALFIDVEQFFQQCDPKLDNMYLYGLANGTWEVKTPGEEIPPEYPEPVLGINFARDGMERRDWIAFIATHSDAWLLSVAFFFGGRSGFSKNERKRLFHMINQLPTIVEVVVPKKPNDRSANHNSGLSKSSAGTSRHSVSHNKASNITPAPREQDEEEDGEESEVCGVCEETGGEKGEEFWICCDTCEIWFHGRCVNITPTVADKIEEYECRRCKKGKKIKA